MIHGAWKGSFKNYTARTLRISKNCKLEMGEKMEGTSQNHLEKKYSMFSKLKRTDLSQPQILK
tara:strand:+ start:297 stop:485 length:189 start_codon:yes stop_codon:yes gene_type:complete